MSIKTEVDCGFHLMNLICEDRVSGRKCQFRDLKIRMLEGGSNSFSVSEFIKSNSILHIFMSSCIIFQPDGEQDVDLMLGFYPSDHLNQQFIRLSDRQMNDLQLVWKFERIASQRGNNKQEEIKQKEETKIIDNRNNNDGIQREEGCQEMKQNKSNSNSQVEEGEEEEENGNLVNSSKNNQQQSNQVPQDGTNCNALNIDNLTKQEALIPEEENNSNNVKEEDLSERTLDSPSSDDVPQCQEDKAVVGLANENMDKMQNEPTFQPINRKRKAPSFRVKSQRQNQQYSVDQLGSQQNREEKDTSQQDESAPIAEDSNNSILEGLSPPKMKKQHSAPVMIEELPFLSTKINAATSSNKPLLFRNSNSSFQAYNPLSSIIMNKKGNSSPMLADNNSQVPSVSASIIATNNHKDQDNGINEEKTGTEKSQSNGSCSIQAEQQSKLLNDSMIPNSTINKNPNIFSSQGLLLNSNFPVSLGGAFQAAAIFGNPGSQITHNGAIVKPEMMPQIKQSKSNSNPSISLLSQQQQRIAQQLIHSNSSTNLGVNHSGSSRQSRNKERTIREAIQMVTQWRDLQEKYRLQHQARGLQEVADELNISKKVLDYYFQELRTAEFFGFDFDQHLDNKMGVLRKFIEDSKKLHENDNKDFKITRNLQFKYRLREDQILNDFSFSANNRNNTPRLIPQAQRKSTHLPGNLKQEPIVPQIEQLQNTFGSNVDKTMLFLQLLTQQAQRTTLSQANSDQVAKQQTQLLPQQQEQQANSQNPQPIGSQPKVAPNSMEDILSFMKLISSAAGGNPNENADLAASTLCSVAADFLQPQKLLTQQPNPNESFQIKQAEDEE